MVREGEHALPPLQVQPLKNLFAGYTGYFNHLSVTSSRSKRGGGKGEGICVLVRDTIPSQLIKHTRHSTWVQLGQGERKVVVGGAYVHPDTSRVWSRVTDMDPTDAKEAAFASLREDILELKGLGPLVLLGDFNARVGALPDIDDTVQSILDSMSLAGDEVISQHIPTHRQHQDTSPADAFGRLLVEQCCIEAGCILLNGRAPGDEHGACTRGLHCLDYGLTFFFWNFFFEFLEFLWVNIYCGIYKSTIV
jgi:hypothetical protein